MNYEVIFTKSPRCLSKPTRTLLPFLKANDPHPGEFSVLLRTDFCASGGLILNTELGHHSDSCYRTVQGSDRTGFTSTVRKKVCSLSHYVTKNFLQVCLRQLKIATLQIKISLLLLNVSLGKTMQLIPPFNLYWKFLTKLRILCCTQPKTDISHSLLYIGYNLLKV